MNVDPRVISWELAPFDFTWGWYIWGRAVMPCAPLLLSFSLCKEEQTS